MGNIISPPAKTVLVSLSNEAKEKLLPVLQSLTNQHLSIYATPGTHQFLNNHGVLSVLVHKISNQDGVPNISYLMEQGVFTAVINIPSPQDNNGVQTDGEMIRKLAIQNARWPITDVQTAAMVLGHLANS